MLILFDIDGTLIWTGGAGSRAVRAAGRTLYGAFETAGVEFSGRIDPLIFRDLARANGHAADAPVQPLIDAYRAALRESLGQGERRALPGVPRLLDAVEAHDDLTLGLLTGNFADTGSLKLEACGIDPSRFQVMAWGGDSPHDPPERHHLVEVAMDRDAACRGARLAPERVVVIGDTPLDVACAKEHGCRALAVATGTASFYELASTEADLVVEDLSETEEIMGWLIKG